MKTRLAAAIGADSARETYRALAEGVWSGLAHPELKRWLCIAPDASCAKAAGWLTGATAVRGQGTGDLGARLQLAFAAAFAAGAPWVAAVGTDAPAVDAAMLLRAGAALVDHELAIAPALDGGYALIALARPAPELFTDMPWSTPHLCDATLARAASLDLRVALLPPVRDVDTVEDLASFPEDLRRSGPSATRP